MEEFVKSVSDYAAALVVERGIELAGLGVMFALWRWWMGHKLRDRIAALEKQAAQRKQEEGPSINQVLTVHGDVNIHDPDRELRNAIEANTVRGLKELIDSLPQNQLGDGHTYAALPNGTNIVTMADGSIRLALPIRVSASFEGGLIGSLSASLEYEGNASLAETRANWRSSPGAGLLAAKLIMAARTMEDVREIYMTFRAAPHREDSAAANWAFADRLHDAGCGDELYDFGYDRTGEGEELVVEEDIQANLRRWKECQ